MKCLVCLKIGQEHYSYHKFVLVNKWKKIYWKCNGKYMGAAFCHGFPKTWVFLVIPIVEELIFSKWRIKCQRFIVAFVVTNIKEAKLNSLLGRKSILFSFVFCWKGARWNWSSLFWAFWTSLHSLEFLVGPCQACKYFQKVDLVLCEPQEKLLFQFWVWKSLYHNEWW